jgi:hypothetical protein
VVILRRMTPTPDKRFSPRGEDDRRTATNPAENPAPKSPPPDAEAVRKGQDNLYSVTSK